MVSIRSQEQKCSERQEHMVAASFLSGLLYTIAVGLQLEGKLILKIITSYFLSLSLSLSLSLLFCIDAILDEHDSNGEVLLFLLWVQAAVPN